jgi:hypothetical protein
MISPNTTLARTTGLRSGLWLTNHNSTDEPRRSLSSALASTTLPVPRCTIISVGLSTPAAASQVVARGSIRELRPEHGQQALAAVDSPGSGQVGDKGKGFAPAQWKSCAVALKARTSEEKQS